MIYPQRFSNLPAYAFPRLRTLLEPHSPCGDELRLTIGEPRHAFPAWVGDVLAENLDGFGRYPVNEGQQSLLEAAAGWVQRRYGVTLGTDRMMALNGTREGLYSVGAALIPEQKNGAQPAVLFPNPFYQVYMVAALSVGAEPVPVNATSANGFLPRFDEVPAETLERTAAVYVCSPSNPEGAVADKDYWSGLLDLAESYDFRIIADECYAEIYRDSPPVGVLQVAEAVGADPERVVAFHSLSKRSNMPGLRSGFVASGPETIRHLRQLRTYAGSPLPAPLQAVAERLWQDDSHVAESRAIYHRKYANADQLLGGVQGYKGPEAGFFLWLPVDDGEAATVKLWTETGVMVLPGAYLSRDTAGGNPGSGYIRVAMVAEEQELATGIERIRDCLYG